MSVSVIALTHTQSVRLFPYESACGQNPANGLLYAAHRHGPQARTVDLRNSGDTAGPRDQGVGYGADVFTDSNPHPP